VVDLQIEMQVFMNNFKYFGTEYEYQ